MTAHRPPPIDGAEPKLYPLVTLLRFHLLPLQNAQYRVPLSQQLSLLTRRSIHSIPFHFGAVGSAIFGRMLTLIIRRGGPYSNSCISRTTCSTAGGSSSTQRSQTWKNWKPEMPASRRPLYSEVLNARFGSFMSALTSNSASSSLVFGSKDASRTRLRRKLPMEPSFTKGVDERH